MLRVKTPLVPKHVPRSRPLLRHCRIIVTRPRALGGVGRLTCAPGEAYGRLLWGELATLCNDAPDSVGTHPRGAGRARLCEISVLDAPAAQEEVRLPSTALALTLRR